LDARFVIVPKNDFLGIILPAESFGGQGSMAKQAPKLAHRQAPQDYAAPQSFNSPTRAIFGDDLSFTPWHGLCRSIAGRVGSIVSAAKSTGQSARLQW
jgi:hypothetical protein